MKHTHEDGFGNKWDCQDPNCELQIVRPGKVQCDKCETSITKPTTLSSRLSRFLSQLFRWRPFRFGSSGRCVVKERENLFGNPTDKIRGESINLAIRKKPSSQEGKTKRKTAKKKKATRLKGREKNEQAM